MLSNGNFYEFLIENSHELVCYHEVNGRYLFVNSYINKIAGYSPKELIGKNPYDYFHPDDKDYIQKTGHLPSVEGNEDTITEYRFRKKDGSYIWLHTYTKPIKDKEGNVVNLITNSRDITQLVELKNDLQDSKSLLEEASRIAQIGAWVFNTSSQTLNVSSSVYNIFEIEDRSLDPIKLFNFFSSDSKTKLGRLIKVTRRTGKSFDVVLPITTGRAKRLWVRIVGTPQLVMGNVTGIIGVIQNITSQVISQENLRAIINSLTNQKDQLEEFGHIVSHNLRGPVGNLCLLVRFLEQTNKDPECTVYLDHLKKVSDSLHELLNDLVDLIKNTEDKELKLEKVNLVNVVGKARSLLNSEFDRMKPSIRLDFKEWIEISYSKIYMESIMFNLLSNALKYASPKRKPEIVLKTYFFNGCKTFSIKDNGLGIDLGKYKNKIFKLNRTFHQHVNGKGIGLYMIKKQIESMGGKIEVKSEVNRGTEFIIYFCDERT